ncbi:hypothetical protein [Nocardioides sp. B-3]|uniref:hypothetical protein n=1 Tax=Nocardioides sp. B-3 TaxID=2895565 RepID=UPI002153377E|nr:hypothetical protein [Nocardioides sp. B-3]UUZ61936.1 hypothetical protein LP418_08265 [Nocardioides sp. B-3]
MSILRPSDDPTEAIAQLRTRLAADDPDRLLIETSGSTGIPKRVLLSRAAVVASVEASATRRSAGPVVAGVAVVVRRRRPGHLPVVARRGRAGGGDGP